jgi:hypothetical protein
VPEVARAVYGIVFRLMHRLTLGEALVLVVVADSGSLAVDTADRQRISSPIMSAPHPRMGMGDMARRGPSAMLVVGHDLVMSGPLRSPLLCRLWFRPRAVRRARSPNGAPVWLWVARSTVRHGVCIERTPLGRSEGRPLRWCSPQDMIQ